MFLKFSLYFPLVQFESFNYINKFINKYLEVSFKKIKNLWKKISKYLPKFYDFMTIILYIYKKRIRVWGVCVKLFNVHCSKEGLVVSSNLPGDRGKIDPPLVKRRNFYFKVCIWMESFLIILFYFMQNSSIFQWVKIYWHKIKYTTLKDFFPHCEFFH